jgi:hypothetical protein
MDALEIIKDLRDYGLYPTIIDIGLGCAEFRLAVKIGDCIDLFYAGKCLNKYSLLVDIDANHVKDYLYFENLPVDEKVFAEIAGG